MTLGRGPIPVLTTCSIMTAIKNYDRGLISLPELIDQLRWNCTVGNECPYNTAILFFTCLRLSCNPHDFGASVFIHGQDYTNVPEYNQYATWCDWYKIACRTLKKDRIDYDQRRDS